MVCAWPGSQCLLGVYGIMDRPLPPIPFLAALCGMAQVMWTMTRTNEFTGTFPSTVPMLRAVWTVMSTFERQDAMASHCGGR